MKVKPMVELFSKVKWFGDEGILVIGDVGIPCKRLPGGEIEVDDELIQQAFGLATEAGWWARICAQRIKDLVATPGTPKC